MNLSDYREEEKRIRKMYKGRDSKQTLYGWWRVNVPYVAFRKEAIWAAGLQAAGIDEISGKDVLDVGCGSGEWLRMLTEWGADPLKLHGIDLLSDRIEKARAMSPAGLDLQVSNGWPLPFADASTDVCAASTVFSSILDEQARKALADEMVRVTRPGGWVMVFDFAVSDPRNRDTVGIRKKEIRRLFPAHRLIKNYKLILAPPILRRFPRSLMWLALAIETYMPFLCTHRLYLVKKSG